MAGPWEAYQTQPAAAKGPWTQYQPAEDAQAASDIMPPEIPAPRKTYGWAEVPGAAVSNLPKSALELGKGVVSAIAHPLDTLETLRQGIGGGAYNLLPEDAQKFVMSISSDPARLKKSIDTANAIGGMYKDRYGSIDALKRTLAEDPLSAAADLSTILGGGGAAAKLGGASKLGGALTKAGEFTNPVSLVTKPTEAFVNAKQAKLDRQQQLNAVRDRTLAAGQQAGYVVTPGSVSPTGANVITERLANKSQLEQLSSIHNQAVTDKLARKAVGLPETAELTSDAMKQIRKDEFKKGYEPVKQIGAVATDADYAADLNNVVAKFKGASASFPGAVPDEITNLVKAFKQGTFDSGDALAATEMLRSQARGNFKKGDTGLAKAQIAISTALENQIERKLAITNQTDLLNQFRNSRQRMAISHTIEDAIREGTGTVNPKKLASDVQSSKYLSGELKTAGEFANAFPRVSQSSANIGAPTGSLMGRVGAGAIGAGAGYMVGGVPGAALGASLGTQFAPEIVSSGLRNYLLSKTGQARIAPNYQQNFLMRNINDQTARNALIAAQAGQQNNLGK